MVFNSKIWEYALNGKPLYGHIPGLILEEREGKFFVKELANNNDSILKSLKEIEEGKISLLPPIKEKKEECISSSCNLPYKLINR